MSTKTLTQVLSKIKHGTIIRHTENFDNNKLTHDGTKYWAHVGNKSMLLLDKKDLDLLQPFVKYCIYFKVKGKSGFYHCEENGLFDMSIQFDTLSKFAKENIKSVYPKFNTLIDAINHLEYYCKDTKQWIKLCDYPI